MKAKDLRERSTDDLRSLARTLRQDLFSYRMKNCTSRLDDTSLLGKTRKDIARIEQLLGERARGESEADGGTES
jgi:large subunit ribosomal protein L29